MSSANPPPRHSDLARADAAADELDDDASEEEVDESEEEPEGPEDLSDETGIDLTDASELDADNVPADEEFDRVIQAPD